jgi:hypothetical protein
VPSQVTIAAEVGFQHDHSGSDQRTLKYIASPVTTPPSPVDPINAGIDSLGRSSGAPT